MGPFWINQKISGENWKGTLPPSIGARVPFLLESRTIVVALFLYKFVLTYLKFFSIKHTTNKAPYMEKQFSREDATLYLKPVVSSIWSLLLVLVSLPAFGAILGSVFGQKATTFMLLVMASSVSMMVLISITYFFMPKILAKRMSGQKRWYLLYLKHEREVHVRILRFESGQFKASKSLEEGAEMLINIRNDPKAQKEKHIKAHQLRLLELQKEMDKSPKVDDSLLNRHLDVENNKLLDELIRLNSLPEDPDDKMYREHWSDVAVNAQKRAENYRLMVPKTMRSLARIDELLAEITKTK